MKSFSIELIKRLINQQSFNEAYHQTKQDLEKDYSINQINCIKWVNGVESNDKLFDNLSGD